MARPADLVARFLEGLIAINLKIFKLSVALVETYYFMVYYFFRKCSCFHNEICFSTENMDVSEKTYAAKNTS